MNATYIFIVILFFFTVNFLFEELLSFLNISTWKKTMPKSLEGISIPEKYEKSKAYSFVNYKFGIITGAFSFAITYIVLATGILGLIDSWLRQFTTDPTYLALLFVGIFGLASDILSTPIDIYHTFVIEERFGLNKTTYKTYILDKIKGWILAVILGGGIFYAIIKIYLLSGPWFWLLAWGVITFFSLFMVMFYSNIIVPLFNKQTPLPEGDLRDAIEEFAKKAGFNLTNIFLIDGSKRSARANAYFTGFGPKKRIVLYDTLINQMTTDEIVAVLAHEIGHYKKHHIIRSLIVGILQTGASFYILSLFLGNPALSIALGANPANAAHGIFHIEIIALSLLFSPINQITGMISSYFSRKNEYQADNFAKEFGLANALGSGLTKLTDNNLSNPHPHKWVVKLTYSHPPLLDRLENLKVNITTNN